MSEGNDRNREGVAPEAAEEIEARAEGAANSVEAPAEVPVEAPAEEKAGLSDRENAPSERKPKARKAGGKKKKRRRRNALIALAAVLVALLVIFGVLVGYGLGRVRGGRGGTEEEAPASDSATEEIPAYDAFTEELTMENQHALDALSGEDALSDEDGSAALSEEGFFGEEENADAVDENVVVAEFGDGEQLMRGEVMERYNEELASYILSGYSEEEVAETLLDDVLRTMVGERVLARHAEEMGLTELTDEDRAQIETQAKERYEELQSYYGAGGDESIGDALFAGEDLSYDGIREELEAGWWERKLYEALTAGVTVDDAAVQAAYDERLEEQKLSFTEYPDDYEFNQRNGEIILYNLPGYRAVKMLLIGFDDAEAEMGVFALTGEPSEEVAGDPDRQAELDSYYAGPEAKAKQALEELRGGADMDEMIRAMGADEGMKDDQQREMGYYVSADSKSWSEAFVRAAMGIENVGDYSEPVRTEEGVCILQYLRDVPEGEVPLSAVGDALREEVLAKARDDAYNSQIDAWVDESNPSYYPERMQ